MTKGSAYIGVNVDYEEVRTIVKQVPTIKSYYQVSYVKTGSGVSLESAEVTLPNSLTEPIDHIFKVEWIPRNGSMSIENAGATKVGTFDESGKITFTTEAPDSLSKIGNVMTLYRGTYGCCTSIVYVPKSYTYEVEITGYRKGVSVTRHFVIKKNTPPKPINLLWFDNDPAHDIIIIVKLFETNVAETAENVFQYLSGQLVYLNQIDPIEFWLITQADIDKLVTAPERLYAGVDPIIFQSQIEALVDDPKILAYSAMFNVDQSVVAQYLIDRLNYMALKGYTTSVDLQADPKAFSRYMERMIYYSNLILAGDPILDVMFSPLLVAKLRSVGVRRDGNKVVVASASLAILDDLEFLIYPKQ